MSRTDLATIMPGFNDPVGQSQRVFRVALAALAQPATPMATRFGGLTAPGDSQPTAAALLLALLSPECSVWLSPSIAESGAASWLRFHTGCEIVSDAINAQFAWVGIHDADDRAVVRFERFRCGDAFAPESSATCVLEVAGLAGSSSGRVDGGLTARGFTATGPGLETPVPLEVIGWSPARTERFVEGWRTNHAAFPAGIDLFFAAPAHLAGLPRTTRIATIGEGVSG